MLTDDWKTAMHAGSRLAMFDLLPAMASLSDTNRRFLLTDAPRNPRAVLQPPIIPTADRRKVLGAAFERLVFAEAVVDRHEIEDHGLPLDQVNDGRAFLGCTPLDDDGVRRLIFDSLNRAKQINPGGACCQDVAKAWVPILVKQRQVPGQSTISNLAAAAHYMLSRYHVCAALATPSQMKTVIDGYDSKKRLDIATGDVNLSGVGITSNRQFPPDFAIRDWAYKGADDGEADRLRCNSKASPPLIFPKVNGSEL